MNYNDYYSRAYNETAEALQKCAFDISAVPGQLWNWGSAGLGRVADWGTGIYNTVANGIDPLMQAVDPALSAAGDLGGKAIDAVMADPYVAAGAAGTLAGTGLLARRLLRKKPAPVTPAPTPAPKKWGLGRKALIGGGLAAGAGLLAKNLYDKQHS